MTLSSTSIRLGMIGCGVISQRHFDDLRSDSRASLQVVCDPTLASAERARDQYAPLAAVETDFNNALDKHALDAVILCTPNALHYPQAKLALERGVHVLCEKPLAVSREQILDLVRLQLETKRVLSIAHQRRYWSLYATARQELATNASFYGPIQQIHVFNCERWAQGISGSWRDDPAQNAGYFGDAGIHQIDVVFFITGQHAERLFAVSSRRDKHVEIATAIIAQLNEGTQLVAHNIGDANHYREDIHFHGRDGDLLIRGDQLLRCQNNQVEEIVFRVPNSNPATAFLDAIQTGQQTASPVEIALPIFDWTAAIKRSIQTNAWAEVGT